MRKIVFTILSLLATLAINAQTNLDSLYSIWQNETQSESIRTNTYRDYIRYGFVFSDPDSAFVLAQDLISYGEQHNYPPSLANGYNLQGIVKLVGGNFPSSLFSFQKSLKIYEDIGDAQGVNKIVSNMGNIYLSQENYPKAKEYFQRALDQLVDSLDVAHIASTQSNLGFIYIEEGNYALAMENLLKSVTTFKELGEKVEQANVLTNISLILYREKKYAGAMEYVDRALEIRGQIDDHFGTTKSLELKARIQIEQGYYSQALESCNRVMTIAKQSKLLYAQEKACKCLYDSYKALGQGGEALNYLEQLNTLQDSLQKEEANEMLQQIEFQNEFLADSIAHADQARIVKEAHEEEVQKEKQTRNYLASAGLLFLILSGGVFSRWRYVKKSKAVI
jgi:adenylate cyclase